MKYKIILFDLDGTLIDPKLGLTSAIQFALARMGIEEDREVLTPFIGPPLSESFKKYYNFDEKKVNQAIAHFREYFLPKGIYESTVYRGIPELLSKLKKAKRKLYIVTLKPGHEAERVAHYFELHKYFDGIKGPKPDLTDSDKTILIQETLSLIPNDKNHPTVMIGDREHDIIAAHENGIDSIGLTFGYGSHEEIAAANPTHKAHSIKELESLLL